MKRLCLAVVMLLFPAVSAFAGVHLSTETVAELPCAWRGFLPDQRQLRLIGVVPPKNSPGSILRDQYQESAERLRKAQTVRKLSAPESADLGALYLRLAEPAKAVEVLRAAQREFPDDFFILSNLASAWQLSGDLSEATRSLREAIRLAPARFKRAEELQLKLLELRAKEAKNVLTPDDLFGVSFSGEVGRTTPDQRKKLPADDVALVQQLALWFPADGRLLWLLGELANAHGDVRTAGAILEGCVSEFAMGMPTLRKNRQTYRQAAEEIAKLPDGEHEKYRGDVRMKSTRALLRRIDPNLLPAIRAEGINPLPWVVISETILEKPFRPKFVKHLEQLQNKTVSLTGFLHPLGDEADSNVFLLIEFPIGCWFCETPEPTGLVCIELPAGKSMLLQRGLLQVEGTLKLNKDDPEDFLYTIKDAKVKKSE